EKPGVPTFPSYRCTSSAATLLVGRIRPTGQKKGTGPGAISQGAIETGLTHARNNAEAISSGVFSLLRGRSFRGQHTGLFRHTKSLIQTTFVEVLSLMLRERGEPSGLQCRLDECKRGPESRFLDWVAWSSQRK